jgi:hypothetical protein
MVEAAGVVVEMLQIVVVLTPLSWGPLFVWALVMIDQENRCLKRAMVILHLTQIPSKVLQFHSLSLFIKIILNRTIFKGVGHLLTQTHFILKAQIEAEEVSNIGASAT